MSLKAIKEAVAQLHETNPYRRKAMAEIAALEKAATALADDEVRRAVRHAPTEIHDALGLLATIAKEAE
jgi:hypothetical protein